MTLDESARLTPEQLRVAVAERLPHLIHIETRNVINLSRPMETVFLWKDTELIRDWYPVREREWLWIIHEAEKTLTKDQYNQYNSLLMEVKPPRSEMTTEAEKWSWHSDGAQRCRAFLAVTSEVTKNRNE